MLENSAEYRDFLENTPGVLQSAVRAIDPDYMGMTREQALTLGGAMKACGFSQNDYEDVLNKSKVNKGTFAKQWGRFTGRGQHGEATAGTIYKFAQACGWNWPSPKDYMQEKDILKKTKKAPEKQAPALVRKQEEDFKIKCLIDPVGYTSKPDKVWEIRKREQVPTPAPTPLTPEEFKQAIITGHTFYPAIFSKKIKAYDENNKPCYEYIPISQQVFVVDIDNEEQVQDEKGRHKQRIKDYLSIEKALDICKANDIEPFLVYETFSSKAHREDPEAPYTKFRLCFVMDKPVTVRKWGEEGRNKAVNYFINLFGAAADKVTTDAGRLIYGTDEKDRAKLFNKVIDSENFMQKLFTVEQKEEEIPEEKTEIEQSAAAYISMFKGKINESVNTPAISTGFNNLDNILDGGLYEGLYFIGAVSSLGKTTFCLQMADQIADQGHDVLIFSLEMARTELMAKSISRLTFLNTDNHALSKTTRGIMTGSRYSHYNKEERALINASIEKYGEYAKNIYIFEGIGDIGVEQIREKTEQHIKITGKKPVIIIDYVQIMAPYNVKATDKQNTDKAVLELKRLSRDCKIPVIGISSFNRVSYKPGNENAGKVNMTAFKESGAIEYSADVLIGLEFASAGTEAYSEEKAKKANPREIRAVILKNRNGKTWVNAEFNYYSKFNCFEEQEIDDEIPKEFERPVTDRATALNELHKVLKNCK